MNVAYAWNSWRIGTGPVWAELADGRIWINGLAMAQRLGVDLSQTKQVAGTDPVWFVRIIGDSPSGATSLVGPLRIRDRIRRRLRPVAALPMDEAA